MKIHPLALAALAVVTVARDPGPALASDDKGFHASGCLATDGIETAYSRSEYRITRVNATGNGQLFCPVTRDVYSCGISGCVMLATLTASVLDSHFTSNITCTFTARDAEGFQTSFATASTSAAPAVRQDLPMSIGWPPSTGTYSLVCTLPANDGNGYTRFFSYKLSEND